jgi:hypothetical protein
MRVLAAVLPYLGQVLLPVLACEPRAEAFAAEMTGDHVNVQVSALLGLGMTLLAAADQLPARVKRWRLHLPDRGAVRRSEHPAMFAARSASAVSQYRTFRRCPLTLKLAGRVHQHVCGSLGTSGESRGAERADHRTGELDRSGPRVGEP